MPKLQKGFVPIIIIIIIVISVFLISGVGFYFYKYSKPVPKLNLESSSSGALKSTPVASSNSKKASTFTPNPSATATPSSISGNTNSPENNNSSNNQSSSNIGSSSNSNSSNSVSTSNNTPSPTPSPSATTQAVPSCDTVCFDRSEANVVVQEGENLESGGWTSFAFNLYGKGSKGFALGTTLPAGVNETPSSGGFADGTNQPIKIWINNNNSRPYGDYSSVITLKTSNSEGSYYDTGHTLNLKVTYKQKP